VVLWFGGLENVDEFSVGFVVVPVGSGFRSFPLSSSPLFSSLYHFPGGRVEGCGPRLACHLVVVA